MFYTSQKGLGPCLHGTVEPVQLNVNLNQYSFKSTNSSVDTPILVKEPLTSNDLKSTENQFK